MQSGRQHNVDSLLNLCFVSAREAGKHPAHTIVLLSFLAQQPNGSALEKDAAIGCEVHRTPIARLRVTLEAKRWLTVDRVVVDDRKQIRLTITAAGRNVIDKIIEAKPTMKSKSAV